MSGTNFYPSSVYVYLVQHRLAGFKTFLFAILLLISLSGCSDLKFVNQKEIAPENDPREDLVIKGLSADLTSAGLVQHHVSGTNANFSQVTNQLKIADIEVRTYSKSGETQGVTSATQGTIYMADDPEANRKDNDILFAGGVNYRSPSKQDPNSDLITLDTESLVYDGHAERFQGDTSLTASLRAEGKRPVTMTGSSFRVPRDLSRFTVNAGTVSQSTAPVTQNRYKELSTQVQRLAEGAIQASAKPHTSSKELPYMTAPTPTPELPPVPKIN